MAVIKDGEGTTHLRIDAASKAARVSLYDPATGLPMASYIRGTGIDLDTTANGVDMRDAIAIALPGPGGAQIAGTSATPLRTDPTGTTTQPVSGTIAVGNFPATQPVSGTVTVANPVNAVQVNNFPTSQAVSGSVAVTNFPGTQTVAGTVSVGNFPQTQPVSGTVGATVRTAGADVSPANPLPTTVTGSVAVVSTDAAPVVTRVVPTDYGFSYAISLDMQPTTLADGTTYWVLRNNGTRHFYIRRLDMHVGFIGTAAASRSTFGFFRCYGAPTGGSSAIPVKKVSSSPTSQGQVLSAVSGLTTTGVTFDPAPFHRVTNVNQLNSNGVQSIDFGVNEAAHMQLAAGEGIAMRAIGSIVAGAYIAGSTGWHER